MPESVVDVGDSFGGELVSDEDLEDKISVSDKQHKVKVGGAVDVHVEDEAVDLGGLQVEADLSYCEPVPPLVDDVAAVQSVEQGPIGGRVKMHDSQQPNHKTLLHKHSTAPPPT